MNGTTAYVMVRRFHFIITSVRGGKFSLHSKVTQKDALIGEYDLEESSIACTILATPANAPECA